MKNINLGHQQRTFDFEPSHEQDLQIVLTFIDSKIAENDQVMLDHVVNHFSIQPDRWSEPHILDLVFKLFKDDKIHFIIDGKKILPENIKTHFSEPAQSKLKSRHAIEIIETHIYEKAKWKSIEIIKPEVVEEHLLLSAIEIGETLFNEPTPLDQNSLCLHFRRHLRAWKNGLENFQKVADAGKYPGINEIQKRLDFSRKLLNVHAPFEFINCIIKNKDVLESVSHQFAVLDKFYKKQIYIWDELIKSVEDFEPNQAILEKDPGVKKALETLFKIFEDPEPYSLIKEIKGLISIVKAANDPIVDKQIAAAKALSIEKINKKIVKIVKVLDDKKTGSDIRNKALFPLNSIKRKIDMASTIPKITDYMDDAVDEFDKVMDMIDSGLQP